MTDRPKPAVPPWSIAVEAARLIMRGVTYRTANRVSLVVGTILSTVNQGSVITHGDAATATWVREDHRCQPDCLFVPIATESPFL